MVIVVGAYFLGRSNQKTECVEEEKQIIIQEKEVIKYVEKQKGQIYSAPNAGRSELLRLFHNGEL